MQGRRDTNVPTLKQHSNSRNWLVGVPKGSPFSTWLRSFFWPNAMVKEKVPAHMRSEGMYCPMCRKRQPFSDRCAFCSCTFSSFVIIKPDAASQNKQYSNKTVPPGAAGQVFCHGLRTHLHASLARFSKASFRARAIALSGIFLLLVSLVVGIEHYRSEKQRQYTQNYVMALYVIKSGMNLGEMVCNGTFNAWRGVESSTVIGASGIAPQALADLESVKAEINRIMGTLAAPPAEYSQAAQILQKLYGLYEKTNSIVINSPNSLTRNMTEIAAAREEFSREIGILKANLPAPLAAEVGKAGQKYDLSFMAAKK